MIAIRPALVAGPELFAGVLAHYQCESGSIIKAVSVISNGLALSSESTAVERIAVAAFGARLDFLVKEFL